MKTRNKLSAAWMCGLAGITNSVLDNQTSYIGHWIKELENDSQFIVKASTKANHAVSYIINDQKNMIRPIPSQ